MIPVSVYILPSLMSIRDTYGFGHLLRDPRRMLIYAAEELRKYCGGLKPGNVG